MSSTTLKIEDIIDANSHHSAMSLTAAWAETFQKYALGNNEVLSDNPGNSFNVFLHLTAMGAAKMMYEQAARINEVTENTAILPKSLITKLNSEEITGIFGIPAETIVAFCIKKKDIIKFGIEDSINGIKRLKINKNMTFVFESHPEFKLPYDILINAKPLKTTKVDPNTGQTVENIIYNIYAYYDMPNNTNDGMRSVYNIQNQYISSREMRFENDVYIAFFLKVFQMSRKEVEFNVTDPFSSDASIDFEDNLVGFEVFYKNFGEKDYKLMRGLPEGNPYGTNTYTYSYDYKRNRQNLNILFSKMNDHTAIKHGSNIKIIVYTTTGEKGNISFPYVIYNLNSLLISYSQNLAIPEENALLNFVSLAFARDTEASNGRNQLSFEKIREKIINKKYSRNVLITHNEILNKAKELGLDANKLRHDSINIGYVASDKITYKDMILSTGTGSFIFDLKDTIKFGAENKYLITPSDVFVFDHEKYKLNKKPSTYNEYVKQYNTVKDVNSIMQVQFPFYVRYDNEQHPRLHIYDFFVNQIEFLKFSMYQDNLAMDKIDIQFLKIYRNPFDKQSKSIIDNTDTSNTYFLNFIVYTSENTINRMLSEEFKINSDDINIYKTQFLTFNIEITGKFTDKKFVVNPLAIKITNIDTMFEDKFIAYQVELQTDNYINEENMLNITGIKLKKDISENYSSNVQVDTIVSFKINGKFNDPDVNPESKDCITYETEDIPLVQFLSNKFNIDVDLNVSTTDYKRYKSNVYKKYEDYTFIHNPNYDKTLFEKGEYENPDAYEFEVEKTSDGKILFIVKDNKKIPKFKVLHKKGDIVYEYQELDEYRKALGPLNGVDYYELSGKNFKKLENLTKFEDNKKYYVYEPVILHKKGSYKYFDKNNKLLDSDDDPNGRYIPEENSQQYTAILKNVPWINRLYFSNEKLYEKIRGFYYNILDRVEVMRKTLFDGGSIYSGLKTTSGKSKRYKAVVLSENRSEFIDNIALKLVYKVKFKNKESSEYKIKQIVEQTVKFIKDLGEKNFSVDGLFDIIKQTVTDIEYINIIQINQYKNGEVQTIINTNKVNNEILTIAQKLVVDESGNIDFEPDITVLVIENELI